MPLMSARFTFLFCLVFCLKIAVFAQPIPCGPNPVMTPLCQDACVICDINGFTGQNNSAVDGVAPPGFCTMVVHNITWIAFIAGSTSLTLTVTPSGCNTGNGLEVGIFYSIDCQTVTSVSNCDTDIGQGEIGVISSNVPLVIGQYYYLVMDGNGGDICNYTINVTQGTTLVQPLTSSGPILGPSQVCKGGESVFTVPPIVGANFYQWTIDGAVQPPQLVPEITVDWPVAGQHYVCVTAYNVCDTLPKICHSVLVVPLPPTDQFETICLGDTLKIGSQNFTQTGIFSLNLTSPEGCDSTVVLHLTVKAPVVVNLPLTICQGDSVVVGGQAFKSAGNFDIPFFTALGCDSLVKLALNLEVCPIHGTAVGQTLACFGDSNGELTISFSDGLGPYNYSWKEATTGSPSGNGIIQNSQGTGKITGLSAGFYGISVVDANGNPAFLAAEIIQPPPIQLAATTSVFGSFDISCPGEMDGFIKLLATGGTSPISFLWNNGSTADSLVHQPAGIFGVTISDANGCSVAHEFMLEEPAPLHFSWKIQEPGCNPPNSGFLFADPPAGGTGPYLFSLNGGPFGSSAQFTQLLPGSYKITMEDAVGCRFEADTVLAVPLYPTVELGPDQTINLADSLRINADFSPPAAVFEWKNTAGLSCQDCPNPTVKPFVSTTYVVTVTLPSTCSATDSLRVTVVPVRRVFVPNVFSPDDDGANDFLLIYGGPEVLAIRQFKIFNRWGELVFEKENFQPNDFALGWDGSFRGKKMDNQVLAWFAEVEFLDGVVEPLKGDLTVVR